MGYEIKSDLDTLRRLPHQAEFYSRVFDETYLVTTERHDRRFQLPVGWGVIVAVDEAGLLKFEIKKPAEQNHLRQAQMVLNLLRMDELVAVLKHLRVRRHSTFYKMAAIREIMDALGEDAARALAIRMLRARRTRTARQLGMNQEQRPDPSN